MTREGSSSLSRSKDVPVAPVSEIKLVGEGGPESGALPATEPRPDAGVDPTLDVDWPTLAVLSRRYIDRALDHTHGNKTRAADLLGIDRRTLNRILARERARKAAAARGE
jgi:DNA-binding NtrC family response regulator